MNIVNLTPHTINLRAEDGSETSIPASGDACRVTSRPGVLTDIPGAFCPVYAPDTTPEVEGLPDPVQGTWYLVSGIVAGALRGTRSDVLVPGTGPDDGAIRNEKGWIVAVTRLKLA